MKTFQASALMGLTVLVSSNNSLAWTPGKHIYHVNPSRLSTTTFPPSRSQLFSSNVDEGLENLTDEESISIAYDKWRTKFKKGEPDPVRFDNFKKNYVTLMRANTAALKKANELGMKLPSLMSLNQFADCSVEEYRSIRNSNSSGNNNGQTTIRKEDPLIESVSTDRPNLKSNGLHQPDESSISNGYQPPDVSVEGSPTTADYVRQAYLKWCEEFGRTVEEERYEVFRSNYLALEKHCQETGKKMKLNIYADFTAEEYQRQANLKDMEGSDVTANQSNNKLSDPNFLRTKTTNVSTDSSYVETLKFPPTSDSSSNWGSQPRQQGFSTSYLDSISKSQDSSSPAGQDGSSSSYLDSISPKSPESPSPADLPGLHENIQGENEKPSFLDSLNKLTGSSTTASNLDTSSRLAEARSATGSTSSPTTTFDAAAYAKSLSMSSQSTTDTSQQGYSDAIARQQGSSKTSGTSNTYVDPPAQASTLPSESDRIQSISPPDSPPEMSMEEIEVYKRQKEEEERAAEEAREMKRQLKETQARLAKEVAEAARRREEEEKAAANAASELEDWNNVLNRLVDSANEATKLREAKSLGKNEKAWPSFGVGSWFRNEENEVDSTVTKKPSPNLFGFFGSKDKTATAKSDSGPERVKPKSDWWKSIVFDFFGSRNEDEDIEQLPGRGTVRIDDAFPPKNFVFDIFINPASIFQKDEPGRSTVRVVSNPKPSIFSFFANANTAVDSTPFFSLFESKGNSDEESSETSNSAPKNSIFSFLGVDQDNFFFGTSKPKDAETIKREMEEKVRQAARTARRKLQEEKIGRISQARNRALEDKKQTRRSSTRPIGRGTYTTGRQSTTEGTPTLSMWSQNENGSISGFVSNSKDYQDGTKITTSPVPPGAKPGSTVRTRSGSTYRLGLNLEQPVRGPKMPWQPKDDIPVLTRWRQQPEDGSLTGYVRNSKDFVDGTRITTSPVEMGAKGGTVVRTRGGTLYRLQ